MNQHKNFPRLGCRSLYRSRPVRVRAHAGRALVVALAAGSLIGSVILLSRAPQHPISSAPAAPMPGDLTVKAGGALADAAMPTPAQGVERFHKDIQPLLKQYCYDCHGDGASNGNVSFDTLASDDQVLN